MIKGQVPTIAGGARHKGTARRGAILRRNYGGSDRSKFVDRRCDGLRTAVGASPSSDDRCGNESNPSHRTVWGEKQDERPSAGGRQQSEFHARATESGCAG